MPSFSEAMDCAANVLYQASDELDAVLRTVVRRSPRARVAEPLNALFKGLLWIAATVALNHWAGYPPVLQLLYLLPVWIAFEKGGLGVAACLAALVVPVSAVMSPHPAWGALWDVVVRSGMMTALVIILAHHSRLFHSTHESARRDALTGALNRAGFEAAAREAIDGALVAERPLTLVVIDCDHFKELNDYKGHSFGDQVLRTLVRVLNGALPGAVLGRTGGDEFVIVDPRRTPDQVREGLAEGLKRFTDQTIVLGRRSTFSVGVAQLGPDGMRYEALLESADQDMYRAKFERHGLALV